MVARFISTLPRAAIFSLLPQREAVVRADASWEYERAVLAGERAGLVPDR